MTNSYSPSSTQSFYTNLYSFIAVSFVLLFINIFVVGVPGGHLWAIYPIAFWALNICFHASRTFGKKQYSKHHHQESYSNNTDADFEEELVPDDHLQLKAFEKQRLLNDQDEYV